MDLKRFTTLLNARTRKPKLEPDPNTGAARLQRMGGLHPYDSHAQRERYARQEARRIHKLALLRDDDG